MKRGPSNIEGFEIPEFAPGTSAIFLGLYAIQLTFPDTDADEKATGRVCCLGTNRISPIGNVMSLARKGIKRRRSEVERL
jgi:hypothetical protein